MAQTQKKKTNSTLSNPKQYGGQGKESLTSTGQPPTAEQVTDFHANADTDVRLESLHHTLGALPTQASPGDHTHDGGTSPQLLAGTTITGSRGGNTAVGSVIQALVRLGAQDATSA